ncbi:MAG TPA: nucleoside triphosphate pyrophosphohydrolase [Bacteroidales bacterium]|nr:nucleoside triphosphate pyrophosphohydrolase [Bacteroidales bacterium]HPT04643.1 nucleoside triphosphate pyrophosphohydrolase [Bacteroidales bacterium]
MNETLAAFEHLLNIMDELRAKCPWDKKQTLESLRYLTIEETYELSDAVLDNNLDEIRRELGDIMLHIVFYAKIGSEQNAFDMKDVLEGINRKLIRRHPHIYGDVVAKDAEAVKNNWEKIKLTEGRKSVLSGVPQGLPAIVKAYRIQEKARGIGFDWEEPHQVWDKVIEEMNELQDEVKSQEDKSKIESEFGDLLFALVNYARFIGVNPEDALERTNKKFISRFQYLEEKSKEDGKSMQDMTLGEMDVYWNEAKDIENGCSQ